MDSITFRSIVCVLRESGLAGYAGSTAIRALRAAELADWAVSQFPYSVAFDEAKYALLQSPVEVKKNPAAHFAHAVPLSAFVQPGLHVHWPFEPQMPLRQLQVEGALLTMGFRHLPEPEIPSSQDAQPAGHGWHVGPKKPEAHDSHDEPVKPGAQEHVPEAEHTPAPAHGGEQARDSISRRESEPVEGSCVMSGTESQRMTRLFDPELTAAQTFDDRASELADKGVEEFETGVVGSDVNAAWPEYRDPA